jgi:hypothetical protein
MRLRGTLAGQLKWPGEDEMTVSESGQPYFKLADQLSQHQIKPYLSKSRSELMSQLERLEAKAVLRAAQAQYERDNPEECRVGKMLVAEMKQLLREAGLDDKGLKAELSARLIAHLIAQRPP